MGTNYYWSGHVCAACGRGDEPLHIGKASAGWCFALHVYKDGPRNLEDWKSTWETGRITDEYGDTIHRDDLLARITERRDEKGWEHTNWSGYYESEDDFHAKNHSERGPHGLLRHRIDGRHCIGHGAGTWDLLQGDFS